MRKRIGRWLMRRYLGPATWSEWGLHQTVYFRPLDPLYWLWLFGRWH
ncbi:MAG: hypothetical protein ACO1SX_19130 [Actinomycetota bacterium]